MLKSARSKVKSAFKNAREKAVYIAARGGTAVMVFWAVLGGGVAVALVMASISAHNANADLKNTLADLNSEVKFLQEKNESLVDESAALREDPYYIERVMRLEYGLVGSDESVVEMTVGDRR